LIFSKLHRSSWLCPSRFVEARQTTYDPKRVSLKTCGTRHQSESENHHGDCDRHDSHRAQRSYGVWRRLFVFSRRTRPLVSPSHSTPIHCWQQVLAAATYPDQIPDAAKWADQHHWLTGSDLARAIEEDHLPGSQRTSLASVFLSVLEMMASDMAWTTKLGDAVLAQHQDVLDAVQRMRQKAKDYGYLRSNAQSLCQAVHILRFYQSTPHLSVSPYMTR